MPERRYRRGDRVRFDMGGYIYGVIKEDRGNLGVNGRRLYLIEFPPETRPPFTEIELPADDFELVEPVVAAK